MKLNIYLWFDELPRVKEANLVQRNIEHKYEIMVGIVTKFCDIDEMQFIGNVDEANSVTVCARTLSYIEFLRL